MVYRGRIHNRKLIVDQPVELPDGTQVRVEIEAGDGSGISEPGRGAQQPIEDILADLAATVPDDEWRKLPPDLSDQIDHYVYGLPKR